MLNCVAADRSVCPKVIAEVSGHNIYLCLLGAISHLLLASSRANSMRSEQRRSCESYGFAKIDAWTLWRWRLISFIPLPSSRTASISGILSWVFELSEEDLSAPELSLHYPSCLLHCANTMAQKTEKQPEIAPDPEEDDLDDLDGVSPTD